MKLRHEYKHYINFSEYTILSNRLKMLTRPDRFADQNGEYTIRSLYFDDYNDKALCEKIMGIAKRDKFRIRLYNNDPSFIRLEKKSKINGLCSKISAQLSAEQCRNILHGEIQFLKDSTTPLLRELYVRMTSERLKPKTVVDYVREAYIYPCGNVRITFDKSVKTGLSSIDLLNPNLNTVTTIDPRYIILEVKYDEFLPQMLSDILQTGERSKTAVSKYALCRTYG